jgi:hypothetical protein
MKNILPALFLIAAPCVFAMDWPSTGGVMTKNFGWNDRGQPRLGITIEGEGSLIAAEDGELLCQRRDGDTASRLPSPLGSWVALDHGDGIISIYSRFDSRSSPAVPYKTEKGRLLGEAGTSGWSTVNGCYFQLFDRKEKRWINPAMIVSMPEDERPPVIQSVRLVDAQGRSFDPSQARTLGQGRYIISVDAADTMRAANESPLAPYRIICSLNGSEAGALAFETYSARDGILMVYRNGLVPVKQVYARVPAYEAADVWFSRGQTNLEIIAQDITGNARSVIYRFTVE